MRLRCGGRFLRGETHDHAAEPTPARLLESDFVRDRKKPRAYYKKT